MICLDTSWSMEGPRENLAKAVVVECVRIAHMQQRQVRRLERVSRYNRTLPVPSDPRTESGACSVFRRETFGDVPTEGSYESDGLASATRLPGGHS